MPLYTVRVHDTQDHKDSHAHDRLDVVLSAHCKDLTRSFIIKNIKEGYASVNHHVVTKPSFKVYMGDELSLFIPPPEPTTIQAVNIPLNIVFEDDLFIVLDKPAGFTVHPAAGHKNDTVVNALLYHTKGRLSGIGGILKPGIVHRIDKDTSGLMIVAKSDHAHQHLTKLWHKDVQRSYTGFVLGFMPKDHGTVHAPLGRHPIHRKKMAIKDGGKESTTHYKVIKTYLCRPKYYQSTKMHFQLETGRTHQIRVHMASIHHALIGDPLYGIQQKHFPIHRQALHASSLTFMHPNGQWLTFTSPIPQDMQQLEEFLQQSCEEKNS